ncbi:hypothetical protein [Roseisolibacter sp. H3M3-2]|uniref:hypothetical protein n=1 Tax=Roseisolibacter sp. H3M3-2 TaxID=3031323 RepID=UPI0023D9EC6B|nr:hypothetical protein [Roseisolibacter sp. H3M3-2]MDF1505814.1 hypothetical protein [Roseisolibacter sp. H3M3-2]
MHGQAYDDTQDGRWDGRAGGAALFAGTAMLLTTMAFHPTGHAILRDASGTAARLSAGVHALALAAVPLLLLGGVALTRRLRGALAELALCCHAVGLLAGMIAGMASGFLSTSQLARAQAETGAAREATLLLVRYSGLLNQASARVLVGMGSAAILCWSASALRSRRLPAGAAWTGIAVGATTLLVLLAGRLSLGVHGYGAVVLGQAVWFVLAGRALRRPAGAP